MFAIFFLCRKGGFAGGFRCQKICQFAGLAMFLLGGLIFCWAGLFLRGGFIFAGRIIFCWAGAFLLGGIIFAMGSLGVCLN